MSSTSLKIYFACSIRGGRENVAIYAQLVRHIRLTAQVLCESFADISLTDKGTSGPSGDIYHKDTTWIAEADAVIAEVTTPSLGVGYEIAYAESIQKPVLALFRQGDRNLSAMIEGSSRTKTVHYTRLEEAEAAIDAFIASQRPHD
jgi:nucleoside 2-deoxyribosyltransferase